MRMTVDYHHQKANAGAASRVAERLKTERKLGNFKKNPEMLEFHGEYLADHSQHKF